MAKAVSAKGAHNFAAQVPYAFAKTHGVLPAGIEGDAVVVLMRPDATPDGVIEIRRVLQRSLVTRSVDAETFAFELARAYNQTASAALVVGDLARENDLARLMLGAKELKTSEFGDAMISNM